MAKFLICESEMYWLGKQLAAAAAAEPDLESKPTWNDAGLVIASYITMGNLSLKRLLRIKILNQNF